MHISHSVQSLLRSPAPSQTVRALYGRDVLLSVVDAACRDGYFDGQRHTGRFSHSPRIGNSSEVVCTGSANPTQ